MSTLLNVSEKIIYHRDNRKYNSYHRYTDGTLRLIDCLKDYPMKPIDVCHKLARGNGYTITTRLPKEKPLS